MTKQVYGKDWKTWHNPDGLAVQFPYKTAYPYARDRDWGGTLARIQKDLTTTSTTVLDWDRHNFFNVAVTMDTTFTLVNPRPNSDFVILLTKDNSATTRNITWGFTIDWADMVPVVALHTANETALLYISYFGGAYRIASVVDNIEASFSFLSPLDYGAVGNGTTIDTLPINNALEALRESRDSTTRAYSQSLSLGGRKYKVDGPLNATGLFGYGARIGDGTIITDATSGAVLDMTGSRHVIVENLTISSFGTNDNTDTGPDVGILNQRYSSGNVAGNNMFSNIAVAGTFNDAALVNYASEQCIYNGLILLQNYKRSEDAAALHIQRRTTAPGITFPSSFDTNATGAQSDINMTFDNLICLRNYATSWTISAISKANPGVFTYSVGSSGIAPEVGDVITISSVNSTGDVSNTWATLLKDYVFTIDTVTPATATTGTFTLTGVDTSGLTGDYDASSPLSVFYRTGPGIRIVHRDRLLMRHFYVATYGSHGIELATGGQAFRGLTLHGHIEGDALQAWIKFVCGTDGTSNMIIHDLDIYEHASHIAESFFATNATTGSVTLYNPKINIVNIRVTGGAGESDSVLRSGIFDDPSKYFLYNADITIGDAGYMNAISEFGHFSGRVYISETNETIIVPDRVHVEAKTIKYYDDFEQWSLAPFWNTRLGTHGSCAAALTSTSARGGRLLMSSGADAAGTYATNGVQLHGRSIFIPENGTIDVEFGCRAVSATTDMAYFVGLALADQTLEMPVVLAAGDTITPTATNFAGFLFDTAADAPQEYWHAVSRKLSGTPKKLNLNLTPELFVAGETTRMRVVLNNLGDAEFYVDGVLVASFTDAVWPESTMCPFIGIFSRAAASRSFSVDHAQIFGWK